MIDCVYENDSEVPSSVLTESAPVIPDDLLRNRLGSSIGSPDEGPSGIHTPGLSETELIEAYLDQTVQAFAETGIHNEQLYIWQILIPAIAYKSDEVRRGMLTLASIYSHYQAEPSSKWSSECLDVAEYHGERFVRDSRRQMVELDQSKLDATLACSRLLCVLGFAFYGIHRRNGITLLDDAAWTWLQLLRGVKIIHDAITEAGHTVHPAFMRDMVSECSLQTNHHEMVDLSAGPVGRADHLFFVQTSHKERFEALTAVLDQMRVSIGEEDFLAMRSAVHALREVTEGITSMPEVDLFRSICIWPIRAPMQYMQRLKECSPIALAIYAHWLMLVLMIDNLWWVNDMGKVAINEISEICTSADPQIQALLKWPQHMVNGDLAISDRDGIR